MSLMSLLKKWENDGYTIKNEKYQKKPEAWLASGL